MKFGLRPVLTCEGAILAHSIKFSHYLFEKGRRLSADDVIQLGAAQIETITVAMLEPADIGENEAAQKIAHALCGSRLDARPALTGRANLHAQAAGVLRVDAARINAANGIDEGLTIATLPEYESVTAGQMVATIKIIPYALPATVIERALDILGSAALSLAPYTSKRMALITTVLPNSKPSVIAKTKAVTAGRIAQLESELIHDSETPHATGALSSALAGALAVHPDIILIAGAAATGDRGDMVPEAVIAAGGRIQHFGMPVDPGNLLLMAEIGATQVLGLPGCARSPKRNGVDLILERLAADIPVTSKDVMALGVGGLLKDSAARPQPRNTKPQLPDVRRQIGAVLLAAGLSRRMGQNKLLCTFDGQPLVRHSANALLKAGLTKIIVVTGHEADLVREALNGLPLRFVGNPDFASGLASSLVCGISALEQESVSAALIALGDMPLVAPDDVRRLIAAYEPEAGRLICVPSVGGKQGNPVLWSSQLFDELKKLTGDKGAKSLIAAHSDDVFEVAFEGSGILTDVDTPEALARLKATEKTA